MIEHEGPGWRLARNPSRDHFTVVIGGEGWALELNEYEWTSLVSLVEDLLDQHHKLESQLMPEEMICLEIERLPWWGCLEGDKETWSLQLILEGNDVSSLRGFEVYWPAPAAQSITCAMRTMWDSSKDKGA